MTPSSRDLINAGFLEVSRAKGFLESSEFEGLDQDLIVRSMAHAPDPDQALLLALRLVERHPEAARIFSRQDSCQMLIRLLGASSALGEFLIRSPQALEIVSTNPDQYFRARTEQELGRQLLESVQAYPSSAGHWVAATTGEPARRALRIAYRMALLDLTYRDLGSAEPQRILPDVAAELADLAAAALEAGLAVSRAEAAEQFGQSAVDQVNFSIIGMGKCGARELNYISDVDVIYVHQGIGDISESHAADIATHLASGTARSIMLTGGEPPLWEVDANLRPEGKDGALSRTLASHEAYYQRWAASWEFQALLKARCIAGDRELGERYERMVSPLVWTSSEREGFVESVQKMRRRVHSNISKDEVEWQIKLGPGGLRDVEFTVQLLQLVHGRVESELQVSTTTLAIQALSELGFIGREDALNFDSAYRFLRLLEHRIQLGQLRRTHLMPRTEHAQRVLARAIRGAGDVRLTSAEQLMRRWNETKRLVRSLHERIFYRPLLVTSSNLTTDDVRLTPESAQARLRALGYLDPKAAMRHIEALTVGVSRTAALQRQLLPVLLGWFAEGVDPDAGLLGFRRLSESLGKTHWFLGMLRDTNAAAERLSSLLSNTRFLTDLLAVESTAAAWLGNDQNLTPLSRESLDQQFDSIIRRNKQSGTAIRQVRVARRKEFLRVALADGAGLLSVSEVGHALSDIDAVTIGSILRVLVEKDTAEYGHQTDIAVIAMGRQGGAEIGYGSDADVMFVQRPRPTADPQGAQEQALRVVTELISATSRPLKPAIPAEVKLQVDADLRPEGKAGALVRSLESYTEYYTRWLDVWERQALLRARLMAGDQQLGQDFMNLIDPIRYGQALDEQETKEIRKLKARVEAERLPRGADPAFHLKLGRGSLSDVEWLVQFFQLQHAKDHPELRTTSTRDGLRTLAELKILSRAEVKVLDRAWVLATRIRSAEIITSGRSSDVLPRSARDMEAVGRWCGYEPNQGYQLEDDYLKATRQARMIFERRFYGFED
ncbi:bifunctional [glutamine synthetase] adenylyltransferase/[glutamine synthetase]-adenylyl-L-tyrosine phosphorylase [Glutamicibacter sp. MNS18]|uniref:bifunctional [glutamine synthetase] adenylyltransferase/[glutamine synthetase]-adenylyl-L-tyrosine phosphorylase n=1 Tax=Glutamicibacter sp. MNS18 TaxID=2989817 RepID=UPI0022359855|nr:bifunctional [glutamine synthetase] adenylyltransferase/[glutamine synthetase]-adenylyl-L-tyrosine phosphorylase [Glutamicibacter sp. MNS18]MCW4464436.1 bifunctional [glutamine synthetase] adenylyltransferase/[glutamine synthetase]-adenylyl-L-tyrosine phosphorylase [Glutamicibacter sp. MNS18]